MAASKAAKSGCSSRNGEPSALGFQPRTEFGVNLQPELVMLSLSKHLSLLSSRRPERDSAIVAAHLLFATLPSHREPLQACAMGRVMRQPLK